MQPQAFSRSHPDYLLWFAPTMQRKSLQVALVLLILHCFSAYVKQLSWMICCQKVLNFLHCKLLEIRKWGEMQSQRLVWLLYHTWKMMIKKINVQFRKCGEFLGLHSDLSNKLPNLGILCSSRHPFHCD